MNNDYIYWTFSSAAQSIAALVGLGLAGYALVHNLMEAAREKDDSLDDIHRALREKYHLYLTIVAWLTGVAIILSLVIVYSNRPDGQISIWIVAIVATIDILSIVCGVAFVVSVVDPRKYEKAAKIALEEASPTTSAIEKKISTSEFFDAFLYLERLIRNYLKEKELYVPSKGVPQMSYSFRQMIDALLQNEKIDRALYNELVGINKYRNLVFHGHVSDVKQQMVQKVRDVTSSVEKIR